MTLTCPMEFLNISHLNHTQRSTCIKNWNKKNKLLTYKRHSEKTISIISATNTPQWHLLQQLRVSFWQLQLSWMKHSSPTRRMAVWWHRCTGKNTYYVRPVSSLQLPPPTEPQTGSHPDAVRQVQEYSQPMWTRLCQSVGIPNGPSRQWSRSEGCITQDDCQEGPGRDEDVCHYPLFKGPDWDVEPCVPPSWCCNNHEAPPDLEEDAGIHRKDKHEVRNTADLMYQICLKIYTGVTGRRQDLREGT